MKSNSFFLKCRVLILNIFYAEFNRGCSPRERAGYACVNYFHIFIIFAYLKKQSFILAVHLYFYYYRDIYQNQHCSPTANESDNTYEMPLSPIKQYVLSIHSYVYVILGCIFKLGDKFLFQTNEEEFYFIYAHVSLPGAKSNILLTNLYFQTYLRGDEKDRRPQGRIRSFVILDNVQIFPLKLKMCVYIY